MITLEEFNKRILRPYALEAVKAGKVDDVIKNETSFLIDLYRGDPEMIGAIVERIDIINARKTS